MKTILAALLMLLAGCAEARPEHSAPYAVSIGLSGGGVCSATVVGRDLLISASHCWGGKRRLVAINGEDAHALEIIHDGADHALVRVNVRFTRWAVMGPKPETGDRLTIAGNIGGIGLMYRELVVAGEMTPPGCPFFEVARNCDLILIDGTTGGGDSGAGYFNSRGELVAVHTGVWMLGGFPLRVVLPLAFDADDWRDIRA